MFEPFFLSLFFFLRSFIWHLAYFFLSIFNCACWLRIFFVFCYISLQFITWQLSWLTCCVQSTWFLVFLHILLLLLLIYFFICNSFIIFHYVFQQKTSNNDRIGEKETKLRLKWIFIFCYRCFNIKFITWWILYWLI